MPLTLPDLVAAVAVVAVAATVQGAVGFGSGLLAAPFLVLIDPLFVPGPMLFMGEALAVLMVVREKQALDQVGLRWALPGSFVGIGLGAALVANVPRELLGLMLGAAVLMAVVTSAFGVRIRRRPTTLTFAGLLSGFMGTTTSIGGPPIALAYQDASGPQIRATLATYFAISTALSIAALVVVGAFRGIELVLGIALLPGVIFGLVASGRMRPVLDRGYTRPAVLLVAGIAGVSVVIRTLFWGP